VVDVGEINTIKVCISLHLLNSTLAILGIKIGYREYIGQQKLKKFATLCCRVTEVNWILFLNNFDLIHTILIMPITVAARCKA
jgi:hypothetical protein